MKTTTEKVNELIADISAARELFANLDEELEHVCADYEIPEHARGFDAYMRAISSLLEKAENNLKGC